MTITNHFSWCQSCERATHAAEWALHAGHCPYCGARGRTAWEWEVLRQHQADLPEMPLDGKVYRFRPAPSGGDEGARP